jgi:Zn finger protein HypA/HybF involved in hydrogenase expression
MKTRKKDATANSRPCLKCNKNFVKTSKFDCVCPQCEVRNEFVGGRDCRVRGLACFED